MTTELRLRDEERQVLGALFIGPVPLDELAEFLRPDDFALDDHGRLWADVLRWHNEDPSGLGPEVILSRALQGSSRYGGPGYVSSLGDVAVTTAGAVGLAKHIREAADKRRVQAAYRMALEALSEGESVESAHALVERAVDSATRQQVRLDRSWAQSVQRAAGNVVQRHRDVEAGRVVTLPMPMPRFAQRFVMEPGELVILGARPGMGKSSFAMQLVECCEDAGFPTCTFMLEMTEDQTIARLGVARARGAIKARDATQGQLNREQLNEFIDAAESMTAWRGELWDEAGLTVEQIGRRARNAKRNNPDLALIVVDHIGKVSKSDARMSEYDKLGHVSGYLKNLAKELGVVVLALCQLNRKVEERVKKVPRISDLRDSGRIEEDADSIIFLYRGDYYDDADAEAGVAEVIVAKQRQGESGIEHQLKWDPTRFRFTEIERPWAVYGRDA
jgi:replicative DNA helicase